MYLFDGFKNSLRLRRHKIEGAKTSQLLALSPSHMSIFFSYFPRSSDSDEHEMPSQRKLFLYMINTHFMLNLKIFVRIFIDWALEGFSGTITEVVYVYETMQSFRTYEHFSDSIHQMRLHDLIRGDFFVSFLHALIFTKRTATYTLRLQTIKNQPYTQKP